MKWRLAAVLCASQSIIQRQPISTINRRLD
jgi:hypothetical protein